MKTKVLTGLAVVAGLAVAASSLAVAQDVIAKRKELMKGNGAAAKAGSEMVQGKAPFDAAKAATLLTAASKGWAEFAKLFPDTSKTGGETTASPKIWETRADFEAKGVVMAAKAAAASAAAAKGPDAFKTAFGEFTATCTGCHDAYRIPKM